MRILFLFILILFILPSASGQWSFIHYQLFDINNISTPVTNIGQLDQATIPMAITGGFEWPKGSGHVAVYASLPWLAAKVNGEVRTSAREYSSTYNPGPMDTNTHHGADRRDSLYRVYKIERHEVTSRDYQHWPSSLGAPVRSDGTPQLMGDQTLWCVYNCADSSLPMPFDSKPLGVEVQQTVFGFASLGGLFKNLMLIRYLLINKSMFQMDSMYFGYWSDPDIGDSGDDRDGCDSTLSLWFCYNATDSDAVYGLHPPAVGYCTVQGPRVVSGNDTAFFKGSRISGYKNLPMTSFMVWPNDGWSNPRTAANIYRYFQLTWWATGKPVTYGGIGTDSLARPTRYMYSGDPESGTGWLSTFSRHEFSGCGPFSMTPGDTQEVVMGILVSRGTSNTNSVTKLRNEIRVLRDIYADSLYKIFVPQKVDVPPVIPDLYELAQNFPNPFNAGTEIRFSLPIDAQITLTIYNVLGQHMAVLASGRYPAGSYTVRWEPATAASGIYFYQLNAGRYIASRKMLVLK